MRNRQLLLRKTYLDFSLDLPQIFCLSLKGYSLRGEGVFKKMMEVDWGREGVDRWMDAQNEKLD